MSSSIRVDFLKEEINFLLKTREMSDVTLVVGKEKKKFPTHRFLLSLFSEKFKRYFYGPNANKPNEVILVDENVEVFDAFMRYMYTGELNVSLQKIISMLFLSEKFTIKCLMKECAFYLERNFSLNNIIYIYETATTLNLPLLKEKSWKYIADNTSKVLKDGEFNNAKIETVLKIISEDNISLDSELDVYNAVVNWGRKQFGESDLQILRKKIDPLIQKIRFISMTNEEFVGTPCEDGILSKEEQLKIFKDIAILAKGTDKNIIEKHFKNKRITRLLHPCYLSSPSKISQLEVFPYFEEELRTECKEIHIFGISFCLKVISSWSIKGLEADIHVECKGPGTTSELGITKINLAEYENFRNLSIFFEKPIILINHFSYSISITLVIRSNKNLIHDYKFAFCDDRRHSFKSNELISILPNYTRNHESPHFSALFVKRK